MDQASFYLAEILHFICSRVVGLVADQTSLLGISALSLEFARHYFNKEKVFHCAE